MSLIYDPSAIRYATTQTAYGTTWTLNKVEDDGAQVWKNTKGQEAVVPSLTATVRSSEKKVEDWVFDGKDDTVFIPMERATLTGDITAKGNRYIQSVGRDIQAIAQTGAKMFVHDEVNYLQQNADKGGYTRAEAKNRLLANLYGKLANESNGPKNDKTCGMFAGKSYPYRKSCRKPNEGDRSVSAGNNFLYEYCNNEWWVIGHSDRFLDKPETSSNYFNKRNTRLAGDGTTNLRWDGLKWRNVK